MTTAGDIILGGGGGAATRLGVGATNTLLKSNGTTLSYGTIVNVNVDNAAAIAGTKISPDFGSQVIGTTGNANLGSAVITGDLTVDTNTLFVDSSDDVVGINTATPDTITQLHVVKGTTQGLDTVNVNDTVVIQNNAVAADSAGINITGGTTGGSFLVFGTSASRLQGLINYSHTADEFQLYTNGSQQAVLDSSGQLGINETAPESLLHVTEGAGTLTEAPGASDLITIQNNSAAGNSAGINISAGTTGESFIVFGDTADRNPGVITYSHTSDEMQFFTNNAQQAVIDSSGHLGIGTTTPDTAVHIVDGEGSLPAINAADLLVVQNNNDAADIAGINISGGTTGGAFVVFGDSGTRFNGLINYDNNNDEFDFYVNGNQRMEITDSSPYVFKTAGGTWGTLSDSRLKENLTAITDATGKLNNLNPTHFEFVNSGEGQNPAGTRTGFIAQEFATVFPGHTFDIDPKTQEDIDLLPENEQAKGVDADLIPYLVKAIQELHARIDALENP
jgi:hypothetical protein